MLTLLRTATAGTLVLAAALAVATGTLQWRFGGRDIERRLSAVFVKRGAAWKLLGQVVTPVPRAAAASR
jgi:hypothetical protein